MTITDQTSPETHPEFPNPERVAADITELAHATAAGILTGGKVEELGSRQFIVNEREKKLGSGVVEKSHLLASGPADITTELTEDADTREVSIITRQVPSNLRKRLGFGIRGKNDRPDMVIKSKIVAPSQDIPELDETPPPKYTSEITRPKDSDLVNPTELHEVVANPDGTVKRTTVKVGQDRTGSSAVEVTRRREDLSEPANSTVETYRSSERYDTNIDEAKAAEELAIRVAERIVDRVVTLQPV